MTGDEFKAVIAHYGEQNILGFVFDNSSRRVMKSYGEFKLADHYIEAIQCLQFEERDGYGVPYLTVKHVENIQAILIVEDEVIFNRLDQRLLSS